MPSVTRFLNAPLLEVVAELRWNAARDALSQQVLPGIQVQFPEAINATDEEFFSRFAERVDSDGFRNSERLLPYGAPMMPGQAALRFRRKANTPPLLQVGPGVFTANGLPPTYSHWGDFRPVLKGGVEALLMSRDPGEASAALQLTVRYIDAFGDDFWSDGDRGRFIDEVLGFGSKLPVSLQAQLHADRPKSASHQLNLPLADGSNIVIQVGEGEVSGEPKVILDVMVQTQNVSPDSTEIMAAFEANHQVIRDLFVAVTQPVRSILQPVEVEDS